MCVMKIVFDNDLYVKLQSEEIKKRMELFPDKLYLEFGGKLFDDYHATRVLPGFELDSKIRLLQALKEEAEVILCINAKDIERKKVRADYGITYDIELLRLIDQLKQLEIPINSVVITLYKDQDSALTFKKRLEEKQIKTYIHTPTKGYPEDVDVIVSEEGYGAQPYIETSKPLVVVTAPGPCSGKMATCMSQLYHEYKQGKKAGYAKFETFPVWNLPLKHPINLAYEAATADLKDVNMIDSFHLEAYHKTAVNYNRDLEVFPILKTILKKITGKDLYFSPTDMGVNKIGFCITNDDVIKKAAEQEIIRRYYKALNDELEEEKNEEVATRIKIIMNELSLDVKNREIVTPILEKANKEQLPVVGIQLKDNTILTGKQTDLLSPAGSMILNSMKYLTHIPDEVDLLSPNILEPILNLYPLKHSHLNLQEVFIALCICSATTPIIKKAISNLKQLENCEVHASYLLTNEELSLLKQLKLHVTCEPVYYYQNSL